MAGYKAEVTAEGAIVGALAWALAFPDPLIAVQRHEAPRALPHHVKVQGDHSMRFRYLNPNLALLVTGTPDGAPLGVPLCGL